MGLGSWWDQTVVSRIVKCGCSTEQMMELREQIIPLASGRVFELGCGAGANQVLYDPGKITSFSAIEPSPKLLEFARAAAAQKGWQADIRHGFGEAIPFEDESFDTVVCTFTMCSVNDQRQSLAEMRRILRPGGLLLYAEHGRAPDPKLAKWQERVEPVWKRLLGNCHITREVTAAIEKAGFLATPIARKYRTPGPRIAAWTEWGTAVKAG